MQGNLLCPTCGDDYSHLIAGNTFMSTFSGRLDARLTFRCEQGGHIYYLDFDQHKGQTSVSVELPEQVA